MQPTSNLWLWLAPYIILLLFMVYAMMEFTVCLLTKPPPHKRRPITAAKLRARLFAIEDGVLPYEQMGISDNELEFRWQAASESAGRFSISKKDSQQRIHMLLDEIRHELRVCESASSSAFFVGLNRWLPRISTFAGYSAGPPAMTPFIRQIMAETHAGGWTFRPVILPFQATARGAHLLQALTPAPLRKLSSRLLWGILYPLSYCLALAWFFVIGGPEIQTTRNFLIFVLVSIAWWGLWGLIAWMLCGFPQFWRRK